MRPIRRLIVLASVVLAVVSSVAAQDDSRGTSLSSLLGREDLVALARWRVSGLEGHLLCVILERRADVSDDAPLPIRVLTVYREDQGKLTKIFTFETEDGVVNMFPLGDYNGRLFVTWVGGSAYHFRVFAYLDRSVKQVLDVGSKVLPEFVIDNEGRESILVTEPRIVDGRWSLVHGTTEVFKWDGKSYEKLETVPWTKRLQCLSRSSCGFSEMKRRTSHD